ncbi:MAG TPA: GAF domain-containing protein [Salinimicrobium sp.]|nr:GAF domain-containing protein [Salinimicrobium sp.]
MNPEFLHSPLKILISFHKIIEQYEKELEREKNPIVQDYIVRVLQYLNDYPQLVDGITNFSELKNYRDPIKLLLSDLFPHVLTNNEIKAVTIPFQDKVFNLSNKFKNILENAGEDFHMEIRNLDEDSRYIFTCILILNVHYQYNIDFSHPLYYDIPDQNGIMKNYKIDINTDFIEIFPAENTESIQDADVDILLQNIDDVTLWKEKFPLNSYVFKGIAILNLTDVTVGDAISDLKTALLSQPVSEEDQLFHFQEIFRSIYKISDLEVGFTLYNEETASFEKLRKKSNSFILNKKNKEEAVEAICDDSYKSILEDKLIFSISNVDRYVRSTGTNKLAQNLKERGIQSCLLAPIANRDNLLGILELVSKRKNELNSINAIKLEGIIPYMVTAIQRNKTEFENRVKAVIQSECTSIHPSVLWIFEKEAKKFIRNLEEDGLASFRDIAFEDVYPLYGQIDIVASSEARNEAIQKDLLHQLHLLKNIFEEAYQLEELPVYEQVLFRIKEFEDDLTTSLNASSEQQVYKLLEQEVHPIMKHIKKHNKELKASIKEYYKLITPNSGIIYNHRKNYDESVQKVNRVLARYIDAKQLEAQEIYPHYFERYKTDGVEHNIYMGGALSKKAFSMVYLFNLRIWQLKTMCEMENRFYQIQQNMPLVLPAASLILVYGGTVSIRYRMDEKKFDVDGTYNARYEIIKKRIDKAYVKGTEERVTQKGKISIIYSQSNDEKEYLRYVKYLQAKNYLGENVEIVELEDVQGVVGLKAIRAEILYHIDETNPNKVVRFDEFIKDLH